MTRGQITVLTVLGALVLATYTVLGLLVAGQIPLGLPPSPTDMPQPTATLIPPPGSSRQYAIPLGETATAAQLEIRIQNVQRDAWSAISPLNAPIPDSQEVVLLDVRVHNISEDPTSISPGVFRLTGDRFQLYQRPPLILDSDLQGELPPGETLQGKLAFVVARGERNLALAYIPADRMPDPANRWLWAEQNPNLDAFAATFLAPTASPRAGGSRLSPALMGQPVAADDRLELTILSVTRDAWPDIQAMSPLNQPPEEDKEYVLVQLRARFLGEDDQLLPVNWWSFRLTGSANILYPNPSLTLENELKGDVFAGGQIEGYLAFQVQRGEENLILVYDPTGVGTKMGRGVRWLWATEEPDEVALKSPVPASAAQLVSGRSSQQPAAMGSPVLTEGQIEVVVEGATLLSDSASEWDHWTLQPTNLGQHYLVLTLTVRNLSSEERPQSIHWQGFTLQDPYGASLYRGTVLCGTESEGETFPGAAITAYLAFPVADGRRFILTYDPTGLGNSEALRWFNVET